ncbi:hypothetical protein GTP41_18715 [Pseudoduganella sp. DS3]|uniref:Transposase (putative) YhgA-like domain-containing protein n=1 Tax=Pseudoduganella guangdongensis TaxID=2692179 RepID=A0A6N9HKF4_9BURK|nr:hypothetical protein [Pseudoduganella guangdongensis]
MATGSDIDFKQLFAFPEMACELLRCALQSPRPGDMERVNARYINGERKQRHDDIVWCIHRSTRPSIYMLVEFQARPERFMALRMISYACCCRSCCIAAARRGPPRPSSRRFVRNRIPTWKRSNRN